jgi:phosphoribosyl-ATP pyrophosphohydrolase/phosphoribosyl-AMP cyclohydrolase
MTDLRYDERGLVPVVVQSAADGAVLMLAYADRQAVALTLETREAHYYSRSRSEIWRKGATSGNTQRVAEVRYDCDSDALLYLVEERGPACHTGERTCFYRTLEGGELAARAVEPGPAASSGGAPSGRASEVGGARLGTTLQALQAVIVDRLAALPEGSYVRKLHERGVGYVAQKVVEEAGETVVAALLERDDELINESADLLFHLSVLLTERGVGLGAVAEKLDERRR